MLVREGCLADGNVTAIETIMSSVCKLEETMVDCDGDNGGTGSMNGSRDSVDGSRGKDGREGGGEGGCKGDDCGGSTVSVAPSLVGIGWIVGSLDTM